MRILHYHRNIRLEKGGVVRFVLDVCAAMALRGHQVTLASPDTFDIPPDWKRNGAGLPSACRLPVPHGRMGLWSNTDKREIEQRVSRADVVHVHGAWMPTNIQIGRACERDGVPYIVSPHGMLDDWCTAQSPWRKRIYHAFVGGRLFERAAAVHCTAGAELDQSRRWFPKSRAEVIPLLLDAALLAPPPGPDAALEKFPPPLAGAPVVLFLSRLHAKKRPEVLIDAAAILKSRGVACNLMIAGTGDAAYLRQLQQRVTDRGVSDRSSLLGMVTGPIKPSLFASAAVMALPTSQENFGLSLVEAMACGTPVITTRGVDIWPELEKSGGAVLADAAPEAFADALARILADADLRRRMGAAARAWVTAYLDPSRVAAQYEALYAAVATRAGEARAA